MSAYTITLPGRFLDYMSGTAFGQGQPDADAGSQALYAAWTSMERKRVGRGTQGIIRTDSRAALNALAEYAQNGIEMNTRSIGATAWDEDVDTAERKACERVLAKCREVLARPA